MKFEGNAGSCWQLLANRGIHEGSAYRCSVHAGTATVRVRRRRRQLDTFSNSWTNTCAKSYAYAKSDAYSKPNADASTGRSATNGRPKRQHFLFGCYTGFQNSVL